CIVSLFKQKTAYEIETCLEFRRVLFRSYRTLRSLQVAGIDARMPLVDRFFKVGFHDQKYMRFAYIYIRVAAPSTFCPATSRPRIAARSVAMAAVCAEAGVPFVPTFDALRSGGAWKRGVRSEEHTSELQSRF